MLWERVCTLLCCHLNKNVCTHCQATTLDDGKIAETNEKLRFIFIQTGWGSKRGETMREKTPKAENTWVCWQLLHHIDWFACFSLIFLFRFGVRCFFSLFFSSLSFRHQYHLLLHFTQPRLVHDWTETLVFFHPLLFLSFKTHIAKIDFHVKFYVISYHSLNFFIFSNLIHRSLLHRFHFSHQTSFMKDFRWRIQFFSTHVNFSTPHFLQK